jgi:hypothetical protein
VGDDVVVTDVTIEDFMTGLIATCAKRGLATLSLRGERFFEAMAAGYEQLRGWAEGKDLDVRFAVFLDELYGDSPVVREAVAGAVQRDLISLDNPEFQDMRIKFGPEVADRLLADLPGGQEMYASIADAYLRARQPALI